MPEISFIDQSQTGTLQGPIKYIYTKLKLIRHFFPEKNNFEYSVDRVKSPKNLPEPLLPEKEAKMPVKTAQESSDEVDRQLQLLMSNLKTPAFVANRVCQKCCG